MSSKTTKFEGLLEAVPDALVGVDHAGVIRFVNRQTELLFGYERDDLIGAPLETLVPESLRAECRLIGRQAGQLNGWIFPPKRQGIYRGPMGLPWCGSGLRHERPWRLG
jgi:PAS domain-containing protein